MKLINWIGTLCIAFAIVVASAVPTEYCPISGWLFSLIKVVLFLGLMAAGIFLVADDDDNDNE